MSNRVETFEVLVNSHDPTTAIKISNNTEASRDITFTQLDVFTLKVILNSIDHATGVITKGVQLASGETVTSQIKSNDYSANYFTFGSFSQTVDVAAVSATTNQFVIEVSATDATLAGDYIILPLPNSSGVEEEHLFWFQNASGTTGNYPPTGLSGYIYHEVDVTASGNQGAANLKTVLDAMSTVSAAVAGNTVTVTTSSGLVTSEPEVSDSSNLGVSFTQRGVAASAAQYSYSGTSTGQTITYTTGEQEKEGKVLVEINHSSAPTQRTVARQDCKVIRSA